MELGAETLELANTQYYSWAKLNREQLLPSRRQIERAEAVTNEYREKHGDKIKIIFVVPDYYENRPKKCMNGWGKVFLTVTPDGTALPCHTAAMLPGIEFPNLKTQSVKSAWYESEGFNKFRGDDWMKEPCRSCPEKDIDLGGCRCQAYMLAGDAAAADPVCDKSPQHSVVENAVELAQRPVSDIQSELTETTEKPLVFRDPKASRDIIENNRSEAILRGEP